MKLGNGKPPRRTAQPKRTLENLPPLDSVSRCTVAEAALHLRCSVPKVYAKIKSGVLESRKDGGRRFITPASIRRDLDGKAVVPQRAPKFKPLWATPTDGAVKRWARARRAAA